MDTALDLKLRDFKNALQHFSDSLEADLDEHDFIRDASVQRFEYTFEICFKTVKLFLREKYGIEEASPKSCFRALLKTNSFFDEDIENLMNIVNDRNSTVHTYDEGFVTELYSRFDFHFQVFQKVYEVISQK